MKRRLPCLGSRSDRFSCPLGTFTGLSLALALSLTVLLPLSPPLQAQAPLASQPLLANLKRVVSTLEFLGAPLPETIATRIQSFSTQDSVETLQTLIDPEVSFFVEINPEVRVKVAKRPGPIDLQQSAFTPLLVKVSNQSSSTQPLRILSPQAGPVYAGMSALSAQRMQRQGFRETETPEADPSRFLQVALYERSPMSPHLSGLAVEYAIVLIYARDPGTLEATIGFDLAEGNQDLGFRGEVATLFQVQKGVQVKLEVLDVDGNPTTGKFVFRDLDGRVHPPQAKRLAPDFYFQEQIYRAHGSEVILPPGLFDVTYSRGPEYQSQEARIEIPRRNRHTLKFQLKRWINPADYGFYSGDHHIHGAGCAHYTMPTLGVSPADMFLQVKGEGLNVGCVLTWGPCFDFQRQFFRASVDALSEPFTLMKYDLEISGFGSAALGHVCLLNLKNQTYPESEGTKTKGWPTWTTPVLRWAKEQGAVTGYAHSASGLQIHSQNAARRLFAEFDTNQDQLLVREECQRALLPFPFDLIDQDQDRTLSPSELEIKLERAADTLPNLAIPEMNSVGAMEICVTTAAGLCDFISAMDTARIPEWNMWYHILNCGFPLKVSGETDFPCMSGSRVGQGRVYVQLGTVRRLEFDDWCAGLASGRSYVSDGFAHALAFTVNGTAPGFSEVNLETPARVKVEAQVAFAPSTPRTVAQGQLVPPGGARFTGDTVTFHGPPPEGRTTGGSRRVELVVNGMAVETRLVPADGMPHLLEFQIPIEQSSWIALRHFPQLHTNPVTVLVSRQPIRASSNSARWCQETIKQLWRTRQRSINPKERAQAQATFEWAITRYQQIEAQAKEQGN